MAKRHPIAAATYDLLTRSVEQRWLGARRAALVADLEGDVLEIGGGTGANLPHYRKGARLVAIEPDPSMRRRLAAKVDQADVPVQVSEAFAEALPFPDEHFDAVVCTLVLCSVADPDQALAEVRRVLRPQGRLLFIEHVRDQGRAARWQDRLEPLWVWFAAGCHPNRDSRAAIERAGLSIAAMEVFRPQPSVPLVGPFIQGTASR